MTRTRFAVIALLVGGLALAGAARTQTPSDGASVFQTYCTPCHKIGGGDLVGPDLKGVTELRSREWLQQWISAPDKMLARKDSAAVRLLHQFHDLPMPNLGLTSAQVSAVIDYLASPASATAAGPAETGAAEPAATGDPLLGKELFTGAVRFQNGGPPCMACHSVVGIGALGGGKLGPDLTAVMTRYGGSAGVTAFITGLPTPTMRAVWAQTPLTAGESANLVAFLAQAPVSQRPPRVIWQLIGLSALGLVLLLALAGWIWRHRLREVRRPMVEAERRRTHRQPTTTPGRS